ncbi:Endoplasmic reticulum oxidoreductin-1 [Candida viswanathii]|uniref:Endoplasmic reticulum oxidoreductin-1 n=1 Tax=Candida viswanathii TaxID=5486 RepID=A0A367YEB8_9ASCO|nr:Endoplasmic reticulum oxidoreductin-1 [Candida viswanathii]
MHFFQFFSLLVNFICLILPSTLAFSPVGAILPKREFSPFDSPEFCSQIITPTCNTTFSYIDELNNEITPFLSELVQTSYFRYFKINLDKQCKFWNAQHFCATENCAVEVLDDFDWAQVTNENLKPSKLGELSLPDSTSVDNSIETEEVQTCEDLDYSEIDDDHNCVYVNLLNNPERFTGYGGNQSFDVWKAIYLENCFPNTNPMSMSTDALHGEEVEQCIEKKIFYRLVSGLHASIAVHLSNEYLNSETGEFYPNLRVFMERVGMFNDRLSNIYFNYALVSQALVKLNEILPLKEFIQLGYDDITPAQKQHLIANHDVEDVEVYDKLLLQDIIPSLEANVIFNTTNLFDDDNLKEEFRSRFRNVSAIMDCVGCDRCRMWGKIQTIGYGTALKILFEDDNLDNHNLKFRRIEIVALVNTLDRLSKSIIHINEFKTRYLQHLQDVAEGRAQPGVYDKIQENNNAGSFAFPFVSQLPQKKAAPPQPPKSEPPKVEKKKEEQPKRTGTQLTAEEIGKLKPSQRTFAQEFKLAFVEVWEALKFVLSSYKQFPALLGKITLVQLNQWWGQLIGKPVTVEYESPIDVQAREYSELIH